MSMFQALYQGNSKSLHLIVLAAIVLFSHMGIWLFIERTRARIERSTKVIFQRGLALIFFVSVSVLGVSYLYPNISASLGFQVTVSLVVLSVVIHTLTKLSQNGVERTSGYIAGAGGFFVVLVILPALFISNVPKSVVYGVLTISLLVITAALGGAFITLQGVSTRTSDALAAFRAKRIMKVLLCSTTLAAFLLACAPFMLYLTPIESITTFFCSSLVCMSGMHVVTERVGFLVEYAQAQIPELNSMHPSELEYVARRTIDSARALSPSVVRTTLQDEMVKLGEQSTYSIHESNRFQQKAIIDSIIAHQEVEKEIFRALMRVAEPGGEYITFNDFTELILPHIQFSKKMVGENVVGISEESMETLSQIITAAKSSIPVVFCGEHGVGKQYCASLLGKIRGIHPENVHTILDSEKSALTQITELNDKTSEDTTQRMVVVRIDSARSIDSISTFVKKVISTAKDLNVAILVNRGASELSQLSVGVQGSVIVPEVIEIAPLRNRPQDSVCQAIWFLFNEAHTTLGEVGVKRLRVRNSALLEVLAYRWPGNSRELRDSIRSALYFARGSSAFDIDAIVPFLREGDRYVTAPWLRDGIERYFLDFSTDDVGELQFATHVGVEKQFAKLAIQSLRQSDIMTA